MKTSKQTKAQNTDVFIALKIPAEMAKAVNEIVAAEELTRSQYVRRLIKRDISERAVVAIRSSGTIPSQS